MKLSHSETEVRRQKSLERRASRVIGVTICSQPGHQGSLVSVCENFNDYFVVNQNRHRRNTRNCDCDCFLEVQNARIELGLLLNFLVLSFITVLPKAEESRELN